VENGPGELEKLFHAINKSAAPRAEAECALLLLDAGGTVAASRGWRGSWTWT
jgi:hypothetical protein